MTDIYPHIYKSDNLIEALKAVSELEWSKFFKSIREHKHQLFATIAKDDLTSLQGEVKMVAELEGIFKGLVSNSKQATN